MSLNFLQIAGSTALTGAAAAVASVAIEATPFAPGFNAVFCIDYVGGTGTPVVKIQTTDAAAGVADGDATWTDLVASSGIALQRQWFNGTIPALTTRIRANKTAAGDAGTFQVIGLAG